ncbi:hypothetical protein CLOSTMETH_00936 [[Clostridium] methylpentosum DSM 5476]|uniref:Uncharacterized protein n=1 Tax=[Clostridium] methylpentosum DSM 5476 TaxID=537013 RepID=C0EAS2_9FIRM|nr:hypothetical protein CLOSTMETH_00936 [[Clostridium] methylpentosum DSM 5476]
MDRRPVAWKFSPRKSEAQYGFAIESHPPRFPAQIDVTAWMRSHSCPSISKKENSLPRGTPGIGMGKRDGIVSWIRCRDAASKRGRQALSKKRVAP